MENDNKQQLDIACERLRMMIRNERQVIDYKDAWRKMALTSSNKRKEVTYVKGKNVYR
jgi:hypothetical protein